MHRDHWRIRREKGDGRNYLSSDMVKHIPFFITTIIFMASISAVL